MKKLVPVLLLAGSTLFSGCGESRDFNAISGQQGNLLRPAPVARADAYTTTTGEPLVVTGLTGVLVNDSLNAVNLAAVTATFPATTAQGGTVTATDNNGGFTYTPPAGFSGTDTFTYSLNNSFANSTATVTVTVTPAEVVPGFFVDAANGNDATGSFATGSPFATVQAAVTAAGVGADIVVRPGNYLGTVNLLDGQRLLGSGSGLLTPQNNDARPELTGPVILADGDTLDFLRFEGTAGDAVDGDDQTTGTVTNSQFADTTNVGSGVQARSVRGTWTIENNTMNNLTGIGVDITVELGDTATVFVNNNEISGNDLNALGFQADNDGELAVQANDNVMTGNQADATFEVITLDTAVVTVQILGNENDDVYLFSRGDQSSAINVENFSNLETLNTGTVVVDLLPVTDISDAGF